MCTSAFLFSGMQIAIRLTGDTIPLMEQVFFRNIVSLILSFYIIKKNNGSFFGEKKHQPMLFCRSIAGILGLVCMFYAAANAHQADVTIMTKLSPFMITLWAFLFLKEKIAKIQLPGLILAFIGTLIVANPVFNSNLFPLLIAILCAVFSSVSYTLLAYFKNKLNPLTVVMHFSAVCVAISLPFMAFHFVMPNMFEFIILTSLGILGGFGQITLTYAYREAPASEVSIYNYSGILFSVILAFIFLGESVRLTSAIGGTLVVAASWLVYRFTNSGSEEI